MKSLGWVLMLATTLPLAAQEPEDTAAAPPPNGAEAQELRKQIRQRWNEHVRSTLGLSADQTAKLQATEQRFEGQRQPIRARQREINRGLNAELASGTPNQDRVRQLVDERQDDQLGVTEILVHDRVKIVIQGQRSGGHDVEKIRAHERAETRVVVAADRRELHRGERARSADQLDDNEHPVTIA